MNRNQEGITLVEVLATIAILSFIGVIIWNLFFQGYQFSKKSVTKNNLIQETNIFISDLTKIHQTASDYTLKKSGTCGVTVISDGKQILNNINPDICYSIFINNIELSSTTITSDIDQVPITVIISDKNDKENNISINTVLYRLKRGAISGNK